MDKVQPQIEYQKALDFKRMTLEEYWEFEFNSEKRHEFHDGILLETTYKTEATGRICANLLGLISNVLWETDSRVYANSRMVFIPECRKNYYPDVLIVCGKHEMKSVSLNMKATLNPSVVIEVLSDSTEDFDKTKKARCYKKIESLKQLVFIRQDEINVRILNRTDNDREWIEIEAFDDDETVEIGDCKILVKEIYHRVEIIDSSPDNVSDI